MHQLWFESLCTEFAWMSQGHLHNEEKGKCQDCYFVACDRIVLMEILAWKPNTFRGALTLLLREQSQAQNLIFADCYSPM